MEHMLTDFWVKYPMEGKVEMAVKMVDYKLHCAKEALEEDSTEYKTYLLDAYNMLETILNEVGIPA